MARWSNLNPATKPGAMARVRGGIGPWRIVVPVAVILVAISLYANWYGARVATPRYCDDPEGALARLEKIIADHRPAGDQVRRPFLVAAKLLFLIPRGPNEAVPDYLSRLRRQIQRACRQ